MWGRGGGETFLAEERRRVSWILAAHSGLLRSSEAGLRLVGVGTRNAVFTRGKVLLKFFFFFALIQLNL